MSVVRLKEGAGFPVLAPAGIRILSALDQVCQVLGRDLTITSGSEKRGRADTDPHATGEAADLSVAGFLPGEIVRLKALLEVELGPSFTVLYEVGHMPLDSALAAVAYLNPKATAAHIHIQRKRGTVWPATQAA